MWGLNNKSDNKSVLISLTNSEARMFLVEKRSGRAVVLESSAAPYHSTDELRSICQQWAQSCKIKNLRCDWLLSRNLYKTITLSPPKVPDSELASSIKWLVKDQIEQSLDSVLVSYYRPYVVEKESEKLTAVVLDRELIESLIALTGELNLDLATIQVEELASINALSSISENENITGFINEDIEGLIYNFYVGRSLAFTRHIKGRFFPNHDSNSFTLETDNTDNQEQLDRFLLETQRTLDYCISQFFRKPVSRLVLDAIKTENLNLVDSLEQITELPVDLIKLVESNDEAIPDSASVDSPSLKITIAEAGAVLVKQDKSVQVVNFYLPQYQPKPLEFSFKYATGIAVASLIGFTFHGSVKETELNNANKTLIEQKQLLEKTQLSLQAISKNLGKSLRTKNLDQALITKQNELNASRRLLAKVESTSPEKPVLYSEILAALSTQQAASLWLTEIKLSPATIGLSGQTTKPDSIPSYINSMSKNSVLASRFEELTIKRDKQDSRFVNFQMTNGRYNNAR